MFLLRERLKRVVLSSTFSPRYALCLFSAAHVDARLSALSFARCWEEWARTSRVLLGLEPPPWEASSQAEKTEQLDSDSASGEATLKGQADIRTIFQWTLVPSSATVSSTVRDMQEFISRESRLDFLPTKLS